MFVMPNDNSRLNANNAYIITCFVQLNNKNVAKVIIMTHKLQTCQLIT